jgi:predicted HD phosphohydrolase
MTAAERQAYLRHPWSADAQRLRRWDDRAKDPEWTSSSLVGFEGLLRRSVGR